MTAISVNHKEKDLKKMNDIEKIDFFKLRVNGWYLNIGKELTKIHDFGFGVLAINCIIIDLLSQYYFYDKIVQYEQNGRYNFNKEIFTKFLKKNIKGFDQSLDLPIHYKNRQLNDFADIFYSGFRCGVLHNAKIIFGEIESKNKYFLRFYKNKKRLHVNQNILLDKLIEYFEKYISSLKKDVNKQNQITKNFWNKFNHDFKEQLKTIS